jgi:Protein of unknown function (DUF3489)
VHESAHNRFCCNCGYSSEAAASISRNGSHHPLFAARWTLDQTALRRDDDSGPRALRITKSGLEAIDVEDEPMATPKETSVRPTPARAVETPAPEATASRKRISVAVKKSARKKQTPGKAKTKTGLRRESKSGSKQARVLAMLGRPEGATIVAIMRATHWQHHSVRGFFAGVVRKRLGLDLRSEKVDGDRVYRIVHSGGARSDSRTRSR